MTVKNSKWFKYFFSVAIVGLFLSVTLPLVISDFKNNASATYWTDSGIVATAYAGGNGTLSNPYQIATAPQLAYLSNNSAISNYLSSNYFILTNNIDLSGYEWKPIGTSSSKPFKGNFDGQGFTISNMVINLNQNYVGLFGYIDGATITNLRVSGEITVIGTYSYIGGIIGTAKSPLNLIGLSNNITITATDCYYVGGIAGSLFQDLNNITLQKSYNSANITGKYNVGGLVGSLYGYSLSSTAVVNCYNTGTIIGYSNVGGIIGNNYADASTTFENIYNIGNITGLYRVGGVIASISTENKSGSAIIQVKNAYNKGQINGKENVGGIIGQLWNTSIILTDPDNNETHNTILNAHNYTDISGDDNLGGIVGYIRGFCNIKYVSNAGNLSNNTNKSTVGGIVGNFDTGSQSTSGSIINYAYNSGYVGKDGSASYAGGIIGYLKNTDTLVTIKEKQTTIKYSSNSGSVKSEVNSNNAATGGIIGYGENVSITSCTNTGKITGYKQVGGIIGHIDATSGFSSSNTLTLSSLYNQSQITAEKYLGGLIGYATSANKSSIVLSCSYNRGTITKSGTTKAYVGSICGYIDGNAIKISGTNKSDSNINVFFLTGSSNPNYAFGTFAFFGEAGSNASNGGWAAEKNITQIIVSFSSSLNLGTEFTYQSGNYPFVAAIQKSAISINLTDILGSVWGIDANKNGNNPYLKDYYW